MRIQRRTALKYIFGRSGTTKRDLDRTNHNDFKLNYIVIFIEISFEFFESLKLQADRFSVAIANSVLWFQWLYALKYFQEENAISIINKLN